MDDYGQLFASLFEGEHVRLAARDPAKDAEIESRWTHDPDYLRAIGSHPAVPRSPSYLKRRYETEGKDKEKEQFVFGIHARSDDRLLGFVALDHVQPSHGSGVLTIAVGEACEQRHGYRTEALNLMLRYAFAELNLHRLSLNVFEHNQRAIRCYEKVGFVTEGRVRQCFQRDGRGWDLIYMGILRSEWEHK